MNRQKLENQLKNKINELLPILKKNNNVENLASSIFLSQGDKTIVKITTQSEMEYYDGPRQLISSNKNINKIHSEKFIDHSLVNLYHELLACGSDKSIDVSIKNFIDSLFNKQLNTFFIFSEVENIKILDDLKYDFVDCSIKRLYEDDLPLNMKQITPTKEIDQLHHPVIYTKVNAGDIDKAKELALHNFLVSFNLIKLYVPHLNPVLKGCLLSGNQKLIAFNETDKRVTTSSSKIGDASPISAQLDNNFYNGLKDAGIEELYKSTKISEVVRECLYWFGLGLNENHPSAKLVNFVTVLESTLKRKNEKTELRKMVSERGAVLLYKDFLYRKKAFKDLKEIYDARSTVVHTGGLVNDKYLALLAGGYARAVLISLISMAKDFNGDFDEFIKHLDDVKLGKAEG